MAGNTDSTTTFRADISQLRKAMQEASRQVRLANSEFKAASASMDDWSSNAQGLEAKLKQLNTTFNAQKTQLSLLEDELEKTTKEYGENSAAADRVRIKINNQKAAMAQTEKQLNQYEQELEDCKNGTGRFADELDDVNSSTENASNGFTVMKGALANLVADGIRLAVDALKDLAKETYTVGANFESAMSQVEAVSGATASEIEALTDKAKEMGEKTKFSASESAEAFNYMAMAGWKTEDMINGIEGIMNLAAASGEDLATSSDIVTDALTAMGYGAKDAGRLADVMAAASSNANTNVSMMGETFKYAAAVAGSYGYSMEDVALATGLMANAGIKGTQSGTALRSIMTRLATDAGASSKSLGALGTLTEELGVQFYNADGSMRDFSDVLIDMRGAWKKLNKEEQANYGKKIAGQEALSGLMAIMNASETDFNKLSSAINESTGAAQKMADTMNDNVAGQITLLRSKIEGIMIRIFEKIAPQLRKSIDEISKTLDKVDWDSFAAGVGEVAKAVVNFFTFVVKNGDTILSVLKSIAVAFITYQAVTTVMAVYGAFTTLFATIKAGTSVWAALNATMALSPIGLIAAAVAGLTFGIYEYIKSVNKAIDKEYGLTSAQQDTIDKVNELSAEYKQMDKARKESINNIDAEYDHIEDLKNEYNTLINSNGKVKKGYEDRAKFILGELAKAMGVEQDEIQKLINKNGKLGKSIDKIIEKKRAEAMLNATEGDYQKAIENKDAALQSYQQTQEDAVKAEEKYKKAQQETQKAWKELDDAVSRGSSSQVVKQAAYTKAVKAEETAKKALEDEQKAVKKAEDAYTGYMTTIKNYEGLGAAIVSGDSKKIQQELQNTQNAFITADLGTSRTLQSQATNLKKNYESLQQAVKNGMGGVTQADVDASKAILDKANQELVTYFNNQNIVKEAKKKGYNIPKALSEGIKGGKVTIEQATGYVTNAVEFNSSGVVKKAAALGLKVPTSIKNGLMDGSISVSEATKKLNNLIKFTEAVKEAGIDGKDIPEKLKEGVLSGEKSVDSAIKQIKASAKKELDKDNGEKEAGAKSGKDYAAGIDSKSESAKTAGKNLAKEAKKGADTKDDTTNSETSGKNFVQGFIDGLQNKTLVGSIFSIGFSLAQKALSGLKKGGKEGSPWKTTLQSGEWFTEGFINGINSLTGEVVKAAFSVGTGAVTSLQDAQEEHSPSKITYKSGVNFTKGYIKGIAAEQNTLVKTVKGLVKSATSELLNLNNFNFSEVSKNASTLFSDKLSKQMSYMTDKIAYQNEQKLAEFDKTIANYQKKQDKKEDLQNKLKGAKNNIKTLENKKKLSKSEKKRLATLKENVKKYNKELKKYDTNYNKLISQQEKAKEAYQSASSEMLQGFSEALSEYQSKAQALIDDTINGITDTYQARYDDLINKQDALINKLKGAGNLFEVSGAGVFTINDIKEQTKQIKDYADKLKKIKSKVSSELFDQITQYDIKEGSYFMDLLLGMSEAELKAYNDAYTEKMNLAESMSKDIYKQDFDKVASDYKTAINKAMAGLPQQLEELGQQVMKGFADGLIKDTAYMSKSVKTLVKGMVNTFKTELKIKSPSKVAEALGEYTGEGFGIGLANMVKYIQQTASSIAAATASSLEDVKGNINLAKANVGAASHGGGVGGTTITNNYNLVQNNTSPKSLTALETYNARRQQIAMVKAATQNV